MKFTEAYGVRQQGYCHKVMAAICVIMFGAMCRYDDASGLMWRNIRFEADGGAFEITFDKLNNSQFRQGNKVVVAAFSSAPVRRCDRCSGYGYTSAERIDSTFSADSTAC